MRHFDALANIAGAQRRDKFPVVVVRKASPFKWEGAFPTLAVLTFRTKPRRYLLQLSARHKNVSILGPVVRVRVNFGSSSASGSSKSVFYSSVIRMILPRWLVWLLPRGSLLPDEPTPSLGRFASKCEFPSHSERPAELEANAAKVKVGFPANDSSAAPLGLPCTPGSGTWSMHCSVRWRLDRTLARWFAGSPAVVGLSPCLSRSKAVFSTVQRVGFDWILFLHQFSCSLPPTRP